MPVEYLMCIKVGQYKRRLTRNVIYATVPGSKAGQLRLRDNSGETHEYPKRWFATVKLPPEGEASFVDDVALLIG